jgi:acetyl coenzyme A synthetase (ADP forming)-like protein
VLRDGSTAHVRPLEPSDRAALQEFFESLSERSRALRFFSAAASVAAVARLATESSARGGFGLVATRGDNRILAHAMYGATEDDHAEVAFAVADELQGTGISTILLAHLTEKAQESGIRTFSAEVLPENHPMLEVFRESGFPLEVRSLPGVIDLQFPTALSADARARFEGRDRIAATAALRSILEAASAAVIGASHRPGTVGHETLRNILGAGFTGPVYAVNTRGGSVESLDAYASVTAVPGPVELAVIATPAAAVVDVARQCAAKGVRALVVLSAGFAEIGDDGAERQRELVGVCRAAGMRLVGPNCLGVMNTAPDVRLNGSFAPAFPPAGSVGFLSQSGALGLAIVDHASALGLGISSFVSNGNKADISGNDLLQYWEQDEATKVIVLYLESFGNPRNFARIARRVAAQKPILAVKSGRSSAGAKATSSHTGALVSASDVTVDALFRQSGVIRTDTLSELFDVASLLGSQPVPRGGRVAIVTNAGGLGILCADACEAGGVEVPELPDSLRAELASFLPATAATNNPVDMIATAGADDYTRAIRAVAESGAVDAIVAIFIPPLVTRPGDVADALNEAADEIDGRLPIAAVFASHALPPELTGATARLPVYAYPEDAAGALAKAVEYAHWLQRDHGQVPAFADADADRAAATIAEALTRGGGWLSQEEVAALLACYGLEMPAWTVTAATPEAVAAAARELPGKVAIKALAQGLLHKTDAGGVATGVSARGAASAARRIATAIERAGHELEGFLVQSMAPPGVEMLVGTVHDPTFGAVLVCGGGGTAAEVIGDVALRVTPVTDRDAHEMVASLRTYPLLTGYRGSPPVDVKAVEDVVLRLGALVENHPEVVEVDLNPVIASVHGATVVDARMRVELPPPRRPWPSLGS